MKKAVKELVQAAEEAIGWVKDLTLPNELNPSFHRLQAAIDQVKGADKTEIETGYLLLIEIPDGRRRITATVSPPEGYLSRAGWKAAGHKGEVVYSEEVNDLEWARDDLPTILPDEKWGAKGMRWSETSKEDLIAAMQTVAESVNNHR